MVDKIGKVEANRAGERIRLSAVRQKSQAVGKQSRQKSQTVGKLDYAHVCFKISEQMLRSWKVA